MDEGRRFPIEGYRDELRLFCYRMGGSLQDAEGLIEAAFFQASGLPLPLSDTYSTRTELFKISARLCMDALADQPPRGLPYVSNPPSDPYLPPLEPEEGDFWLEPFPDDLYPGTGYGGEGRYTERECISLPFVAALQSLRPRERLSLILGDAMGWRVETLAEVLGAGVVDARHLLEEARESIPQVYDEELGRREPPPEDKETELLMRYLYPWEAGDVKDLMERLSEDVVLQLPPSPSWYEGRDAVGKHLSSYPLESDARGRWRLLPRRANGQLAFGVYRHDDERHIYTAHSIQVLHFDGELVSEIITFKYPSFFPSFKLLPEVAAQG
jgi:RNA polymerase sigma-70 factor (ECF subfamily)